MLTEASQWNRGFAVEQRLHSGTEASQWNRGFPVEQRLHSGTEASQWNFDLLNYDMINYWLDYTHLEKLFGKNSHKSLVVLHCIAKLVLNGN